MFTGSLEFLTKGNINLSLVVHYPHWGVSTVQMFCRAIQTCAYTCWLGPWRFLYDVNSDEMFDHYGKSHG